MTALVLTLYVLAQSFGGMQGLMNLRSGGGGGGGGGGACANQLVMLWTNSCAVIQVTNFGF